jgi:hypothetical protein
VSFGFIAAGHPNEALKTNIETSVMKTHPIHLRRARHSLLLATAVALPTLAHGQIVTNWTAFNEHAPSGLTAPNVSTYNMRGFLLSTDPGTAFPTSGPLTNFTTASYPAGQSLSAGLVVSTLVRSPDLFPNAAMGYAFPGTPAYDLFTPGGTSIVDMGNAGSAIGLGNFAGGAIAGNDTVVLTFTNLDPSMRYAFRGNSVRNGTGVGTHSGRWTISSLAGADTAVDAGTPGVLTSANLPGVPNLTLTNWQQVFQSGVNTNGDLVGWDDIAPGPDGSFSVITKGYSGPVKDFYDNMGPNAGPGSTFTNAYGALGYALSDIALIEYGPLTPVSIATQPAATTSLTELYPLKLSVKAFGTAPLYQWYKGTTPIPGAITATYEKAAAEVDDTGAYTVVVSNGLNSLTSAVAQVTVSEDVVKPVVVEAIAGGTFNQVTVQFSERVDTAAAIVPFNYTLVGGIDPANATLVSAGSTESGTVVALSFDSPLTEDTIYQIKVSNIPDLAGNMTDEAVTFSFRTWVVTPAGGVKFEVFTGIGGNLVSDLTGHPNFPNSPTVTTNLTTFTSREFLPTDSLETYGGRMRALFIPPATGSWIFYLNADDGSALYLNPTGPDAAGKTLIQSQTECCASFAANASAPQFLTAGKAYYIETLYKEGGGGDICQVAVKLSSDPTAPASLTAIPGSYLGYPSAPAGSAGTIGITAAPANISTNENQIVTFSVTATNTFSLPMAYRWFKNGTEVPDATGPSYSFVTTVVDDGATIVAEASIVGAKVTTAAVTLQVSNDTTPPVVVSASADASFMKIILKFDELITVDSAGDEFGYEFTAGPNLPGIPLATPGADGRSAIITLDTPLIADSTYTLAVKSPTDLANNTIIEGTTVTIQTWKVASGFVTFDVYDTGGGNEVAILTSHPSFPDNPQVTYYLPGFDTRKVFPTNSREGYGGRLSGVFIPPTSGNWVFYLSSDDSSELYFNPSGKEPAGKVLLTAETACCNGFASHASAPQALIAGEQYYIEALYKEGGGGDYCQVAAKLETDPTDPNTLTPIPAAWLGTYVNPVGLGVTITQNPVNQFAPRSAPSMVVSTEEFTSGDAGYSVLNGIEGGNLPGPTELWLYNSTSGSWAANGGEGVKNSALSTPFLTVTTPGVVTVTFSHRYNFEDDGGDPAGIRWDGGLVRVSINRGAYTTVLSSAITGENYKTDKLIGGNCPPVRGQYAFNGQSPGFGAGTFVTSTATLGTFAAGDVISVQFLGAWDEGFVATPAPNWEISSVDFSPAMENTSADGAVTFTAAATATLNGGATPVTYQWQRNTGSGFADIGGATAATYSFLPNVGDDGVVFRVIARSPGAEATSTEATLFVTPKQFIAKNGTTSVISWPAPSPGYELEETSSLLTPATTIWTPVTITPATVGGMNTVTIPGTATGQKFYRLKK